MCRFIDLVVGDLGDLVGEVVVVVDVVDVFVVKVEECVIW